MSLSQGSFNAVNYLVPATGTTHAYNITQDFSTPFSISWSKVSLDQQEFCPSGVYIDNTNSTGPLVINIPEIDFNVICPAGQRMQTQYPAPLLQTANISGGSGVATVVFVDFPVIPFAPTGAISAADGQIATLGSEADAPAATDTSIATLISLFKRLLQKTSTPNPFGSSAVAAGVDVANAALSASLPAVAGKTNYVSNVTVTGLGATAASANKLSLTGIVGGPLFFSFAVPAGVTLAAQPLMLTFDPPLAATNPNAAITASALAFGAGNTASQINIAGYQI